MGSISIILPTRNNENHIGDLLTSIFSQRVEEDLELLILDSSDDSTPQIASKFSKKGDLRIVRVEPEDYNYGGTRNLGASLTSGDFLVFISTDVDIRDDDWLNKLVRPLEDSLVAGVYGRQIPKEDASPMEEFFIKYTYPNDRRVCYLGNTEKLKDLFFSNTNSAIKREIWEKINFPEMLMSEDQEWAKRVVLAGYKIIYEPNAVVYHSHNYDLKQVFKRYFDSGATLPYVYNNTKLEPSNFLLQGLTYEIKQFQYLFENGYIQAIPYAFLYDLFKFLGYFFGTKYKYLPLWLRKSLSNNANHWDKYNDIIILHNRMKHNTRAVSP